MTDGFRDRASFSNEDCSVARTHAIVGERWTMLVLREAFLGVRRFDAFQRNIGVARNILAARLRRLVEHGIMERRKYQDHPPRYEYRLTEAGIDLYPVVLALLEWGDRHVPSPDGAPVLLVHKGCGHRSSPVLACSACGERVTARDMRAEAGPGAVLARA